MTQEKNAIIEFDHVSKVYAGRGKKQTKAVDDVTLSIDEGDIYGIIGYSGAGKSTLVRMINALENPTSGTVTVMGQQVSGMSESKLRAVRQKIGMIFQHFNLMPSRTVAGNVAYPLKGSGLSKEDIQKKVATLLELVGIGDKADAYPSQLSGGQKQRVAIARALATDPEIIYFDEPTSALDPELTGEVLAVMRQLAEEGMTMLVVTHEMGFARNVSSKTVFMENGVVVEQAPSREFFENPKEERTREFLRKIEHTN